MTHGSLFCVQVAALITYAGCSSGGAHHACMSSGDAGAVVDAARLFRLDVYEAATGCAGSVVRPGAAAPLISHTYGKMDAIVLDVAPGDYTLVLTAFADSSAARALGQGCVVTSLARAEHVCFDLMLAALPDAVDMVAESTPDLGAPDLAMSTMPPNDLATASDMASPVSSIAAGTYRLLNRASGLALDDTGGHGVGGVVDQYIYKGADNEQWMLATVGSRYTLACAHNGLVASVDGSSDANAPVVLATPAATPTADQQWAIIRLNDGYYVIYNALSGDALTNPNGSILVSTPMDQEPYAGTMGQEWSILPP